MSKKEEDDKTVATEVASLQLNWKDFVLGVIVVFLGCTAGFLSMLAREEADREFLQMLIPVTGQMLAFTGIIMSFIYPALRFLISDIDGQIEKLMERADRAGQSPKVTEQVNKRITEKVVELVKEVQIARGVRVRVLAGLAFSAACSGAALAIELVHLRLIPGLSSSIPEAFASLSPLSVQFSVIGFFLEVTLFTIAIILLVANLIRSLRLAFR